MVCARFLVAPASDNGDLNNILCEGKKAID